jgi:hypothetical protein
MPGKLNNIILMANLNPVMREVTLDIETMAVPNYAELIFFEISIAFHNLDHEVCKLAKFHIVELHLLSPSSDYVLPFRKKSEQRTLLNSELRQKSRQNDE